MKKNIFFIKTKYYVFCVFFGICSFIANKLNGIVIDNMISSEILCISEKLKKNKVVTLYSSSADAFSGQAKKLIKIVHSEKEAIAFCRKILK